MDAAFLARMEQLLALYALPYDPAYPVICFDERPCFLIGDTLVPVPMKEGQVRKQHYTYEKLGSCALLAAIEPLTGQRLGQVHERRTKREYTQFCQALAAQYPDATKIQLVQDNLNTHNASAFYEHLPAEAAFALAERFTFIYTPKSASWLNMIECEFSVLARLCLNRRIATIERLRSEVLARLAERSAKQIKINWQFSIQAARTKLNTHYTKVHPENEQYKET
jgi:DDE superfamily endonuclease